MNKVFLTERIHEDAVWMLGKHAEVIQGTDIAPEEIIRQAQGCDGVLVRSAHITKEIMDGVPTLRVIAKHGIGVDNIDVEAATERGILVVNAPFANVNAVAEHGLMMILAAAKMLVPLDRMTRQGGFQKRNQYITTELSGKTVGLVGLGRISSLLAQKLAGLSVNLIAFDPFVSKERAIELGVELCSMDALLERSDFISLHTPLTPETKHLISTPQLLKMKNSAWLVNVSRGPVVDEAALVQALRAGTIAGAALDVFEEEPPKDDNPLFALENVILSPHNAALSDKAMLSMATDSARGIIDYLEGRRPSFPVNPSVLPAQE